MAGHVKVPEGAIYVDHREVVAFVFTDHAKDKRVAQLSVYLKNSTQLHFLGERATSYYRALKDRFPYRDETLYDLQKMNSLPKPK